MSSTGPKRRNFRRERFMIHVMRKQLMKGKDCTHVTAEEKDTQIGRKTRKTFFPKEIGEGGNFRRKKKADLFFLLWVKAGNVPLTNAVSSSHHKSEKNTRIHSEKKEDHQFLRQDPRPFEGKTPCLHHLFRIKTPTEARGKNKSIKRMCLDRGGSRKNAVLFNQRPEKGKIRLNTTTGINGGGRG